MSEDVAVLFVMGLIGLLAVYLVAVALGGLDVE